VIDMARIRVLAVAGVLAASGGAAAWAADGGEPAWTEVEVGGSRESLTKNLPDWSSVYVEATHQFKERHTLYGGLRQVRRFNFDDTEAYGGLYYPLSATWSGLLEGTASPQHNVLPEFSVYAQLQKEVARGLLLGLGLRHVEYTTNGVNMGIGSIEYYWSSFRAAYTLYSSHVDGAGATPAHRFQFNYFYADRDSIGIAYTTGREVENVGPPVGLITSDVREWGLSGRHWFTRNWGVTYELLDHEQGNLYRRRGGRLGLRYHF
jgi:YaiO family outer membrane protein